MHCEHIYSFIWRHLSDSFLVNEYETISDNTVMSREQAYWNDFKTGKEIKKIYVKMPWDFYFGIFVGSKTV